MVHKKQTEKPKLRGRPRAYDPEAALAGATDTFWRAGYAGTSLDQIIAATGMNKPSLYAAFGDKRALYLDVLGRYWQRVLADMHAALAEDRALDDALMRVYDGALSIYFAGDGRARGCFVIGTAVTEAAVDREIRTSLVAGIRAFDQAFELRFRRARKEGALRKDADPAALALLATATLHTIAIRARSGAPRAELRELARHAIGVICA